MSGYIPRDLPSRRPQSAQLLANASYGATKNQQQQEPKLHHMPRYAFDPATLMDDSIEQQLHRLYDGPEFDANPAHRYKEVPSHLRHTYGGREPESGVQRNLSRPASATVGGYDGRFNGTAPSGVVLPRRPNSSLPLASSPHKPPFTASTATRGVLPRHEPAWSRQQRKEELLENGLEPLHNLVGLDGYLVQRSPYLQQPMSSSCTTEGQSYFVQHPPGATHSAAPTGSLPQRRNTAPSAIALPSASAHHPLTPSRPLGIATTPLSVPAARGRPTSATAQAALRGMSSAAPLRPATADVVRSPLQNAPRPSSSSSSSSSSTSSSSAASSDGTTSSTSALSETASSTGDEVFFDDDPLSSRKAQADTSSPSAPARRKSPLRSQSLRSAKPSKAAPVTATAAAASGVAQQEQQRARNMRRVLPKVLDIASVAALQQQQQQQAEPATSADTTADGETAHRRTAKSPTPAPTADSQTAQIKPTVAVELATLAKEPRRRSVTELLEHLLQLRLQHQRMSHASARCPSPMVTNGAATAGSFTSANGLRSSQLHRAGSSSSRSRRSRRPASSSMVRPSSSSQNRQSRPVRPSSQPSPQPVPPPATAHSSVLHESFHSASGEGGNVDDGDDVYVRLYRRYRRCECCEVPLPREVVRPQPPPPRAQETGRGAGWSADGGRPQRGRRPQPRYASSEPGLSSVDPASMPEPPSAPTANVHAASSTRPSVNRYVPYVEVDVAMAEPHDETSLSYLHPHLMAYVERELLRRRAPHDGRYAGAAEDGSADGDENLSVDLLRALVQDVQRSREASEASSHMPSNHLESVHNGGANMSVTDNEADPMEETLKEELLRLLTSSVRSPLAAAAYPAPLQQSAAQQQSSYYYYNNYNHETPHPRMPFAGPASLPRVNPYAETELLYPYNIPHASRRDESVETMPGTSGNTVESSTVNADGSTMNASTAPPPSKQDQATSTITEVSPQLPARLSAGSSPVKAVEDVGVQTSPLESRRESASRISQKEEETAATQEKHPARVSAAVATEMKEESPPASEITTSTDRGSAATPLDDTAVSAVAEAAARRESLSSYAASEMAGAAAATTNGPVNAAPPVSAVAASASATPLSTSTKQTDEAPPCAPPPPPPPPAAPAVDVEAAIRKSVMVAQVRLLCEMEETLRTRLTGDETDVWQHLCVDCVRDAEMSDRVYLATLEAKERAGRQRGARFARDQLLVVEFALKEWSRALEEEEEAWTLLVTTAAKELTSVKARAEAIRREQEAAARRKAMIDALSLDERRMRQAIVFTELLVRQELQLSIYSYAEDYTREDMAYNETVQRLSLQRAFLLSVPMANTTATTSPTIGTPIPEAGNSRGSCIGASVVTMSDDDDDGERRGASSASEVAEEYTRRSDESTGSSSSSSSDKAHSVTSVNEDVSERHEASTQEKGGKDDQDSEGAKSEAASTSSLAAVVMVAGEEADMHHSPIALQPIQITLDESEKISASMLRAVAEAEAGMSEGVDAPMAELSVSSTPLSSSSTPVAHAAQGKDDAKKDGDAGTAEMTPKNEPGSAELPPLPAMTVAAAADDDDAPHPSQPPPKTEIAPSAPLREEEEEEDGQNSDALKAELTHEESLLAPAAPTAIANVPVAAFPAAAMPLSPLETPPRKRSTELLAAPTVPAALPAAEDTVGKNYVLIAVQKGVNKDQSSHSQHAALDGHAGSLLSSPPLTPPPPEHFVSGPSPANTVDGALPLVTETAAASARRASLVPPLQKAVAVPPLTGLVSPNSDVRDEDDEKHEGPTSAPPAEVAPAEDLVSNDADAESSASDTSSVGRRRRQRRQKVMHRTALATAIEIEEAGKIGGNDEDDGENQHGLSVEAHATPTATTSPKPQQPRDLLPDDADFSSTDAAAAAAVAASAEKSKKLSPPWRQMTETAGLPQTLTYHSGVDASDMTAVVEDKDADSSPDHEFRHDEVLDVSGNEKRPATLLVEGSELKQMDGSTEKDAGSHSGATDEPPLATHEEHTTSSSERAGHHVPSSSEATPTHDENDHPLFVSPTDTHEREGLHDDDGADAHRPAKEAPMTSVTALQADSMHFESSTDDRRFLSPLSNRSEVNTPHVNSQDDNSYCGTPANAKAGVSERVKSGAISSGDTTATTTAASATPLKDRVKLPAALTQLAHDARTSAAVPPSMPSLSASSLSSPHLRDPEDEEEDGMEEDMEEEEEEEEVEDEDDLTENDELSHDSARSPSNAEEAAAAHAGNNNPTPKSTTSANSARRRSSCTGKDELELMHERVIAMRRESQEHAVDPTHAENGGAGRATSAASERRRRSTVSVIDSTDECETGRDASGFKNNVAERNSNAQRLLLHPHNRFLEDAEYSPGTGARFGDRDGHRDRSPRDELDSGVASHSSLGGSPGSVSAIMSKTHFTYYGSLDSDALTPVTRKMRAQCWEENGSGVPRGDDDDSMERPPTPEFVRNVLAVQLKSPLRAPEAPPGVGADDRAVLSAHQPLPHVPESGKTGGRERGVPFTVRNVSSNSNGAESGFLSSTETHEMIDVHEGFSKREGAAYVKADDYHSPEHLARMSVKGKVQSLNSAKPVAVVEGGSSRHDATSNEQAHDDEEDEEAAEEEDSNAHFLPSTQPVATTSAKSSQQRPPFPWETAAPAAAAAEPRSQRLAESNDLIPLKQLDEDVWNGGATNRFSQQRVRVPSPHPKALRRPRDDNSEESTSPSLDEDQGSYMSPNQNDTRFLIAVPDGSLRSEDLAVAPLQRGVQMHLVDSFSGSNT